uniref:Uncharacterized protein n=1 Tax=Magallana gigas TaxID=29159 RepID=K1QLK0_MAGGI
MTPLRKHILQLLMFLYGKENFREIGGFSYSKNKDVADQQKKYVLYGYLFMEALKKNTITETDLTTLQRMWGLHLLSLVNSNQILLYMLNEEFKTLPSPEFYIDAKNGCGPLPVVKDGEWECPGDVSSLSVPVYESCHIVCKGNSVQKRALVKVRCTEKLEWDRVLTSNACSVEKSSEPCPTIAAMLEGAVNDSIRFVDDLSTLLDPDNPRNWQGLAHVVSSDRNYLCHYGRASDMHFQNRFSEQCYKQNKNHLTEHENRSRTYPYFNPSVGAPPGCGPLPVVNGSKWECPYGVSPLSVPVYESCRVLCKGESLQRRTLVKVRCTEKLEWDHPMLSAVCAVIKSSSDSLKTVEENVAIVEDHSWKQSGATRAGSCPTIAAMLEGAVNDSIRFVDDLSTLLDPDNPGNWQGLIQAYFSLSFNKIQEIRHKTKDHFKEAVLPLLSSHGLSIVHLTSYFYKLPSRRIDVIECIQRYHPYCQECGEIYDCVKSTNVE